MARPRRGRLVTAALLATALPANALADTVSAACDSGVEQALVTMASAAVEQETAIIRNPDFGIRDPQSIFDFSCITSMFNYKSFDIFFSPSRAIDELLGLTERRICQLTRQAYAENVGRTFDSAAFRSQIPRLPGPTTRTRSEASPRPPTVTVAPPASGNAARLRKLLGGS